MRRHGINRTLKSMLHKRAAQYGMQWDKHLPGVLWAYRDMPHDTTGETPSFGWDCKSPSEAALLPPDGAQPIVVGDYRQELIESMSTARQTPLHSISRSQKKYKKQSDSYQ